MNRLDRAFSRLLTLAALLLCAAPLSACNVPVFRYALERWSPRPYEVVVFHKGALAAKDREAVQALERHVSGDAASANLDVELVDLDREPDERAANLFTAQEKPVLPWMVVRAQAVEKKTVTSWASASWQGKQRYGSCWRAATGRRMTRPLTGWRASYGA